VSLLQASRVTPFPFLGLNWVLEYFQAELITSITFPDEPGEGPTQMIGFNLCYNPIILS
jgi:hypothetical protein